MKVKLTLASKQRILELPDNLSIDEVERQVEAHADIMKEYADVEWHLMQEGESGD